MDGYQPPFLSLQDMLNLSDNEGDDVWSNNPFSISNFFEPITGSVSVPDNQSVKTVDRGVQQVQLSSTTAAGLFSNNTFEGIEGSESSNVAERTVFPDPGGQHTLEIKKEVCFGKNSLSEEAQGGQSYLDDEFPNLDVFDEAMVTGLLKTEQEPQETSECTLSEFDCESVTLSTPSPQKSRRQKSFSPTKVGNNGSVRRALSPQMSTRPTLTEVKAESEAEDDPVTKFKRVLKLKYQTHAVDHLTRLIGSLKLYSNQLEDFLANEGDMIIEHYNAKNLLRGVIPDVNESAVKEHPFREAHTIRQVLIDHVKGQTDLSKLPPRKPYLWRGSDLLLLQQTILESVIHQREFMLQCRYTDLLTEMGFDPEDLERLEKSVTKEAEICTMKIILNEHDFYSKLKGSQKRPIKTTIVTKDFKGSGIPRVCVYPSPEKLVIEKWKASNEIKQKTVISNIHDKDINWLHVLKYVSDKNPKLSKIDEMSCKLIYDHLLSSHFNNSPWYVNELRKLQSLRASYPYASWAVLADLLGTDRSPFSCYVKYKIHCTPNNGFGNLPRETKSLIKDCFEHTTGNAAQVDYMLRKIMKKPPTWLSPLKLTHLCQYKFNSRLRKTRFSSVEDALLLVVMEKYYDWVFERNGLMDPVQYALPWRSAYSWKVRLYVLLLHFLKKQWSLEDDERLCSLVQEYGPKYKLFHRYFPFKSRVQCKERYYHLQKVLKTHSLEDYHTIYHSRQRSLNIRPLLNVTQYLNVTLSSKLAGNGKCIWDADLEFLRLRRQPTDYNLECYLMSFPTRLIFKATQRLFDCLGQIVSSKNKKLTRSITDAGQGQILNYIGFDRRKFDIKCPITIGSALHLRGASLVPQDTIKDMTGFEREIYAAYKYFSLKSAVKTCSRRTSIPSLENLRKFSTISRIIMPSQSMPKPGEPSVIMSIKSEVADEQEVQREEQALLKALEEKKKGGRLKGSKRKRTQTKESRKRAAMIRWQNKKLAAGESDEEETEVNELKESIPSVGSAGSPYWEVLSPGTPGTPASVNSISANVNSESVVGLGPSMRKTLIGTINDHAYCSHIGDPAELQRMSIQQLFAKMGGGRRRKAVNTLGNK